MRIIGGAYRGQRLDAPKGLETRPTTDRVRESLFNILNHNAAVNFDGAKVIDCFAGTGALGLEAMSLGAAYCLFVETAAPARAAIRGNCEALKLFGQTRIHRRNATSLGVMPASAGGPFDMVFMDAPYDKNAKTSDLTTPCVAQLIAHDWLAPKAILIIEQFHKETPFAHDALTELDRRQFGDTQIGIFQLN